VRQPCKLALSASDKTNHSSGCDLLLIASVVRGFRLWTALWASNQSYLRRLSEGLGGARPGQLQQTEAAGVSVVHDRFRYQRVFCTPVILRLPMRIVSSWIHDTWFCACVAQKACPGSANWLSAFSPAPLFQYTSEAIKRVSSVVHGLTPNSLSYYAAKDLVHNVLWLLAWIQSSSLSFQPRRIMLYWGPVIFTSQEIPLKKSQSGMCLLKNGTAITLLRA